MADVLDVSPEAASRPTVVIASEISSIFGSNREDGLGRYHLKRTFVVVGGNGVHDGAVDFGHNGRPP